MNQHQMYQKRLDKYKKDMEFCEELVRYLDKMEDMIDIVRHALDDNFEHDADMNIPTDELSSCLDLISKRIKSYGSEETDVS